MSKQDNRANYPKTASIVDELRQYWPDLKVIHSTENGGIGRERKTVFLGIGVYGCKIYLETL